jgi:thymidylate kinase
MTIEANPHGKKAYGELISMLKLVYLWVDYTVGYWLKIYPRVARSTLVMFDRYYHDLLVDPRRYRFGGSRLLAGFFGKILPQPQLWIFLDAPAKVLQERKREVSPQETARQCEAYRRLAVTLPGTLTVDASQDLERVVARVDEAILGLLAARARQRLSSSRCPG